MTSTRRLLVVNLQLSQGEGREVPGGTWEDTPKGLASSLRCCARGGRGMQRSLRASFWGLVGPVTDSSVP